MITYGDHRDILHLEEMNAFLAIKSMEQSATICPNPAFFTQAVGEDATLNNGEHRTALMCLRNSNRLRNAWLSVSAPTSTLHISTQIIKLTTPYTYFPT